MIIKGGIYMGFFEGFIIGSEFGKWKKGSGLGLIPILVLYFFVYKEIELFAINHFTKYLSEMFFTYILITILLYRYSYKNDQRQFSIGLLYMSLMTIDYVLCALIGFAFFNKIGGTIFYNLIEKYNYLGWETKGLFMEIVGLVLWGVFKIFDILLKPFGFILIQKISLYFVTYSRILKERNI